MRFRYVWGFYKHPRRRALGNVTAMAMLICSMSLVMIRDDNPYDLLLGAKHKIVAMFIELTSL